MKWKIDLPALAAGVRTAGALLLGNSILIYTEVIGTTLENQEKTELIVLLIGVFALLMTSLKRSES